MNPDDQQESQWIREARDGSREAFGCLVEKHSPRVLLFLSARMQDFSEAEDLAQETFLTAWRRLDTFDLQAPLGPWLRGIARHLLQNFWRKHRPEAVGGSEELAALVLASQDDWERHGEHARGQGEEMLGALRLCLARLEAGSRELVRRRYEEGASIEQLAGITGRKPSALTMQLHRIRDTLRDCIERRLKTV